jgi:DNA adenine methylase
MIDEKPKKKLKNKCIKEKEDKIKNNIEDDIEDNIKDNIKDKKKYKKEDNIENKKEDNIENKKEDNIENKTDDKIIKKKSVKKSTKKCNDDKYTKPIIKWVGGKTQIIDSIIESFPKKIQNYHELFIGGGSVLFALLKNINDKNIILEKNIYAYDLNETLINMYKNIKNNHEKILEDINVIIDAYININGKEVNRKAETLEEAKTSQESYYYWIRNKFNEMTQEDKNKPNGSAHFIFLNKTCFRGVYREGPHGFNVPFGHYKSPEIINKEHLEEVSKLIQPVEFIHSDFEESFKKVKKNDFIYLDPPYVPENATSFVGYTSDGFNLEKHETLFNLCKDYNFVMSNSDVKLVKDSFNDNTKYNIKIISCKRSINSKKPDSKTNEVIIKST